MVFRPGLSHLTQRLTDITLSIGDLAKDQWPHSSYQLILSLVTLRRASKENSQLVGSEWSMRACETNEELVLYPRKGSAAGNLLRAGERRFLDGEVGAMPYSRFMVVGSDGDVRISRIHLNSG